MKNSTIILVLLLAGAVAFGQAVSESFVEVGYAPDARTTLMGDYDKTFYAQLGVKVPVFTYFFVEGVVETFMMLRFSESYMPVKGTPFCDTYTVGAGVQVGGLIIGVKHECAHPVLSDGWSLMESDAGGGFTKIYARYEVTF